MIGRIWDPLLANSLGPAREEGRRGRAGRGGVLVRAAHERCGHPGRVPVARCRMKFGVFYEHQLPRPWEADAEYRLLQDALEQVELADRLGFDVVWEVEHHFLEEYSHSSAPEVFLGACSQRTKDIRLGHGIIQTAPGYNHPARTAERVATLDLLSGGRVEFGSGESGSEAELGGFLVDPATKRDAWLEGLEVTLRCMTETPFTGVDGRFVQMPPRNVVPKPMQQPASAAVGGLFPARHHPAGGREGHRRAHVRLHRPGGGGEVGGGLRADAGRALRPRRSGREPQHRLRDPNDVPPRRGGGPRPRPGGWELLRVLPRALLRLRGAPAGLDRCLGRVPRAAGRQGYSPEIETALRQERLGARLAAGERTGCAARRAPRARCATTCNGSSRRGRPGDLRVAGRQEPPRAHLRVARAVRPRGAAGLQGARRGPGAGESGPARAGRRRRAGAAGAASRRRPRCRRATPSRPCPGAGPTRRAARRSASGSSTSPTPGPGASGRRGSGSSGN